MSSTGTYGENGCFRPCVYYQENTARTKPRPRISIIPVSYGVPRSCSLLSTGKASHSDIGTHARNMVHLAVNGGWEVELPSHACTGGWRRLKGLALLSILRCYTLQRVITVPHRLINCCLIVLHNLYEYVPVTFIARGRGVLGPNVVI